MNPTYILSGSLEKRQSKGSKSIILVYIELENRVLSIQNNEVSSVAGTPDKAVNKITDDIKNKGEIKLLAVISSQESDNQYIARVSKLKAVRKNGKNMLRMAASSNELDTSGKYAQDCINLDEIPQGKVTMTIIMSENIDFKVLSTGPTRLPSYVEGLRLDIQNTNWFSQWSAVFLNRLPGVSNVTTNWWYFAYFNNNNAVLSDGRSFVFYGEDVVGEQVHILVIPFGEIDNEFEINFGTNFSNWVNQYGRNIGIGIKIGEDRV